jgi:hypothetical protein
VSRSPLVTRAQWGARAPVSTTPLNPLAQKGVAIHYSAAESDWAADHGDCAGRVRGIQRFHMDSRGWADLAYSWLVCQHGYRIAGRGLGLRSAAQGTNEGNASWHAVCFLGSDREGRADVTPEAKQAIADCIQTVRARYPAATAVRPHSAFHSTACPGDELRAWITGGLPRPPIVTDAGDLDVDEKRLIQIIDERLDAKLDPKFAAWYRMQARGVDPATGKVSAAHQHISLEALRDLLDDLS